MIFKEFVELFQQHFIQCLDKYGTPFHVDSSEDLLWDTYLESFPEDERQSFNCRACRRFIKKYGNLVFIDEKYNTHTIWNFDAENSTYNKVVNSLNEICKDKEIKEIYYNRDNFIGQEKDREYITIWYHLYANSSKLYKPNLTNHLSSEYYSILERSLQSISKVSLETVLDLINANNLYKGEEFKYLVESFLKVKQDLKNTKNTKNYLWKLVRDKDSSFIGIKNTVIGSLLVDLSNNIDVDTAVRKYESKVAPTNYKRPKPVFTEKQIQAARKTIESLGIDLTREFASYSDLNLENVLWIKRRERNLFPTVFDELVPTVKKPKATIKTTLDKFISEYIKNAKQIELFFENKHENNLMSLIKGNSKIFKWDNSFSWCYKNNLTDTLKARVEKAGGKTKGKLRISLGWNNIDDLDLHCIEPNGFEIFYGLSKSPSGGHLDVDMNVLNPIEGAVENIIYEHNSKIQYGTYTIKVHNFTKRTQDKQGYSVEVEYDNEVYEFNYCYNPGLKESERIVFSLDTNGIVFDSAPKNTTKNIYNLNTGCFQKVSAISLSPNYWDNNQVGNKHYFFFLENASNTDNVRGIFNEFLKDELARDHKKVFEALGDKINVEYKEDQLTGLGFSSTIPNSFIAKVDNKIIEVTV